MSKKSANQNPSYIVENRIQRKKNRVSLWTTWNRKWKVEICLAILGDHISEVVFLFK